MVKVSIKDTRVHKIIAELNSLAKKRWGCEHKIFNVWNSGDSNDLIFTIDITRNYFQRYYDEYDQLFQPNSAPSNRNIAFDTLNKWVLEYVYKSFPELYHHSLAFFYEDRDADGEYNYTFEPTILTGNESHNNVLMYVIT